MEQPAVTGCRASRRAVLIAELVSLITARLVGLGILGHQTAFSGEAVLGTAAGFLLIKLAAFILLSGRISRMEIRKLLTPEPRGTKKRIPAGISAAELFTGVVLLGAAYGMAIQGFSWGGVGRMAMTMVSGLAGTFLVFFGLRAALGFLARHYGKKSGLHVFCFRQLEEYVIHQPASLAVSSLLILQRCAASALVWQPPGAMAAGRRTRWTIHFPPGMGRMWKKFWSDPVYGTASERYSR